MLGRKDYTEDEIAHARAAVTEQLAAFHSLATAAGANAGAALASFEHVYFNNLVLVLDRYFVHRVRAVSGKDANALNEVELLADSIMTNNGVLRGNNVIKYVADDSVLKLAIGEPIALTAEQFERLAEAFLGEIERKFA
jgi:hypothetical protein